MLIGGERSLPLNVKPGEEDLVATRMVSVALLYMVFCI